MAKKSYRSKLEVLVAKLLTEKRIKFEYEPRKIKYQSRVHGGRCVECGAKKVFRMRSYLPDFVLQDGTVVEAKGRLTPSERTKFLSIRESNPQLRIVFVFGADNKLNKRKDARYSDWCIEHDFEYGIKQLAPGLLGQ